MQQCECICISSAADIDLAKNVHVQSYKTHMCIDMCVCTGVDILCMHLVNLLITFYVWMYVNVCIADALHSKVF